MTPRTVGGKFVRGAVAVARLGHARRRAGRRPDPRLQGRTRPLSSLCVAGLPVGASHADLSRAEEARRTSSRSRSSITSWARTAGRSWPRTARPATRSTASTSCTRSTPGPIPPIRAGSRCRCCGTSKSRRSSPTNSSEIIRMLNSAFDEWGDASLDFYPTALRGEIDAINALVYPAINNGVYRAGFATTQEAYEEAFGELFSALDTLEDRLVTTTLSRRRLASPRPTGGCSPRWCASTRSMSVISSATCAASPTIRTCRTICATSTRCPASPAR